MLFASVGQKRESLFYYPKLEAVGPAEKFIRTAKIYAVGEMQDSNVKSVLFSRVASL